MCVRVYLASLSPYGDNNKIYVCRLMATSIIRKFEYIYVFDKKSINVKYVRIHVYECAQNGYSLATYLIETDSRNT